MSRTLWPSTNRRYGVRMVAAEWEMGRSTVYEGRRQCGPLKGIERAPAHAGLERLGDGRVPEPSCRSTDAQEHAAGADPVEHGANGRRRHQGYGLQAGHPQRSSILMTHPAGLSTRTPNSTA